MKSQGSIDAAAATDKTPVDRVIHSGKEARSNSVRLALFNTHTAKRIFERLKPHKYVICYTDWDDLRSNKRAN